MATTKKLMGTTAVGGDLLAIEDVFSTYLYTGAGSSGKTVTTGLDVANEGGIAWIKCRSQTADNIIIDPQKYPNGDHWIYVNANYASQNIGEDVFSFSSTGFSIAGGLTNSDNPRYNASGKDYVSWNFRKAPRFFDVVTYTGNSVAGRTVSHNLGQDVGFMMIKNLTSSGDWICWHRSASIYDGRILKLNSTAGVANNSAMLNATNPTSTEFTVGTNFDTNGSGQNYVAYLFAHDPLGPSGDGSDGLIACGSYTGNGLSDGPEIDLGWEPQWIMFKDTSATGDWQIMDVMRGLVVDGDDKVLQPNTSSAELTYTGGKVNITPTGFQLKGSGAVNTSGRNYIYIAIRRGPMRQPESGTEVFSVKNYAATNTFAEVTHDVTFDTEINANRDVAITKFLIRDSLRDINGKSLITSSTNAETAAYPTYWSRKDQRTMYAPSSFDGWWASGSATVNNHISYGLVRAPGFFDVVAYTGDGTFDGSYNVNHSLGVTPEMIITKSRSDADYWSTYHSGLTSDTYQVQLNLTNGQLNTGQSWGPTAETFKPQYSGNADYSANHSGRTYIAYLFATLPGVSKVGSYTGNGGTGDINVDCGFTSGARFVLIKDATSANDWYVWDTARGIVAGNDPYLRLNSTGAETTDSDWVDPYSAGFTVTTGLYANLRINVLGNTYIFYAIA